VQKEALAATLGNPPLLIFDYIRTTVDVLIDLQREYSILPSPPIEHKKLFKSTAVV
jgi:hypothetical protein